MQWATETPTQREEDKRRSILEVDEEDDPRNTPVELPVRAISFAKKKSQAGEGVVAPVVVPAGGDSSPRRATSVPSRRVSWAGTEGGLQLIPEASLSPGQSHDPAKPQLVGWSRYASHDAAGDRGTRGAYRVAARRATPAAALAAEVAAPAAPGGSSGGEFERARRRTRRAHARLFTPALPARTRKARSSPRRFEREGNGEGERGTRRCIQWGHLCRYKERLLRARPRQFRGYFSFFAKSKLNLYGTPSFSKMRTTQIGSLQLLPTATGQPCPMRTFVAGLSSPSIRMYAYATSPKALEFDALDELRLQRLQEERVGHRCPRAPLQPVELLILVKVLSEAAAGHRVGSAVRGAADGAKSAPGSAGSARRAYDARYSERRAGTRQRWPREALTTS